MTFTPTPRPKMRTCRIEADLPHGYEMRAYEQLTIMLDNVVTYYEVSCAGWASDEHSRVGAELEAWKHAGKAAGLQARK